MLLTSTKGAHPMAPPNRSDSASGTLWPRRLAFIWGFGILLYAALVPGELIEGPAAVVVTELVWVIAAALATASCWRASRVLGGNDRRAWILFAMANGTWTAARVACLVHALVTGEFMPFPGAGDIGQLALGPLLILALLLLRSTQRERRLTWLRIANLGLILCGLGVVLVAMLTQPFMRAGLSATSSLIVLVESAPVTIAFILGLYVLWSYHWEERFEPVALLTISLALHMISALFYTRALVSSTGSVDIFAVGWLLAFASQHWAGESQVAIVKHGEGARTRSMLERQGWVEALVPGVLVMCIAVTGIALEEEITHLVVRLNSFVLIAFAFVLAIREGLLYSRGQHLRLQLQRSSKQLEASQEQLRDMDAQRAEMQRDIEMAARGGGVGLWDWDLRSNVVRYSREWKRQLGYEDHEIADTFNEWYSRLHPDERDRMLNMVQGFIEHPQGDFSAEQRLRHRDGSYRWILVQGSVLMGKDGVPQRMFGSHVDITDRKNIELSLRESEKRYRELVDSLESRVAERTSALTEAYRESQNMAYAVAHDLKAPLRAIDGFSHLLEQSATQRLNENEQTYIKRVRHGAIHMATLIDSLLAYSRLEHRELRLGAIDCREVVENVVRSLGPAIHTAEASVTISTPHCKVRADEEALHLVLCNLIDNALKFACPARALRIEITGHEEGASLIIAVRDNGIGFDPQYHDKIFEIFNRLHSTGYEGTGIGLALVRKAVHRMHGRVWAESAIDRGATFYISLPLALFPSPAGAAQG